MKTTTQNPLFLHRSVSAPAPAPAPARAPAHGTRLLSLDDVVEQLPDAQVVVHQSIDQQEKASRTDLLIGRMSVAGIAFVAFMLTAEKLGVTMSFMQ